MEQLQTSFKANQLMTGHENMKTYLERFRLQETDGRCECGRGREDNRQVKEACQLPNRVHAREVIREEYGDLEIKLRRNRILNREQITRDSSSRCWRQRPWRKDSATVRRK